jgi:diguanylate cyclase (GGDEF)-like protein
MDGTTWRDWRLHAPGLHRDPLLIGATLWTLLATVLFFAFHRDPNAQVRIFWVFQPPLDLLFTYSAWRVCGIATGPIRQFWRILATVGTLFTIGDSAQTINALLAKHQWSTSAGPVQSICFAAGVGLMTVGMLIHPHPGRTRRERLAFWLDSATVLVGGAVLAWCFLVRPDATDVAGTLIAAAMILTSSFATFKMLLNSYAPIHKLAALPMIIAAGVISIGLFAAPHADGHLPASVYALRLLPSTLIVYGARIQELVAKFDHTAFGSRRPKPYSLLPYGSIAIAFASLIVVLIERNGAGTAARMWGVVAGLGLICGLVAARQLVAFHDNTRLIAQLDTTLAELRQHQVRLRQQALFDGLTGLANRTHFHEEGTATLAAAEPGTVSLLLIDLDGFKDVNDTLGHGAGDALLIGVAGKLSASVREHDLVARLGGDEFAILLRDCAADDADHTSRRIQRALTEPVLVGADEICANASIGVALAEPGDDVDSLLRDADLAMYAAKHEGKGTWRHYHDGLKPLTGRLTPR